MLDYKGKEKDFRVMMEEENVIVYTRTHTGLRMCTSIWKLKRKKSSKRILRGKEKYTKEEKERGRERKEEEKEKGGFSSGLLVKNLPAVQETQVQSLVWEDPTCHVATKSVQPNHWGCALEPRSCNYWSLHAPVPIFWNNRSRGNEKPTCCN